MPGSSPGMAFSEEPEVASSGAHPVPFQRIGRSMILRGTVLD